MQRDTDAGHPAVSVVLPAYNCAGYISNSVTSIVEFFRANGLSGEVLVVDDGSIDGTCEQVPRLNAVKVIRLPANRGKGFAVRTGMNKAVGKVKIFTDADIPYGLPFITTVLYHVIQRGFHAVIGDRSLPQSTYRQPRLMRRLASKSASFLFRTLITGGYGDTQCPVKGFRAEVADEVFKMAKLDSFTFDLEIVYLMLKYNLDIKRIPVTARNIAPGTLNIFLESARALCDVVRIYSNSHSGAYRNERLRAVAERGTPRK
ncbi:MAG: glycosyltransferase [Kiritimatiellia bacterium]